VTAAERSVAVVKRAIQAVNDDTMNQVAASIIAPDFRRHDLAAALPNVFGHGGLNDFLQLIRTALPDFHMEIVEIFGTGDRVTVRWIGSGTNLGEFLGVVATGKRIEWNGITIYWLDDDKLTDSWQLIDVWGIMRQMSVIDFPGE